MIGGINSFITPANIDKSRRREIFYLWKKVRWNICFQQADAAMPTIACDKYYFIRISIGIAASAC
jgi:hypothetical protein